MKLCRLPLSVATACFLAGSPAWILAQQPTPPLKPGEHTELISGPKYLTTHGWRMPYPPYPEKARRFREQGKVYLHLVTDRTGQVVKTSVLRTPLNTDSKTLRQLVVLWALYKWSRPPNASTNVEFEFRLIRP